MSKEKNSCTYHYYSDFGIDTNWVANNCVKTQIISSWVVNNISSWIIDNCIKTQEISTWFGTLPGRVGTYNYTSNIANFTLNYTSGDFLTGATFTNSNPHQILVTQIPVGKGIIARFNFGTNAAGATISFGNAANIIISA